MQINIPNINNYSNKNVLVAIDQFITFFIIKVNRGSSKFEMTDPQIPTSNPYWFLELSPIPAPLLYRVKFD